MSPAISVLLPVYNAAPYVEDAVRSILCQTFTDYELLIINDGSTDNSGIILDKLSREDPRIRLIQRENRGLIATLNQGLALARAPFIARMDADDISLPHRLALQHAYLKKFPEIVALGGNIRLIDSKSRLGRYISYPQRAYLRDALLWGAPLAHPTVMLRMSAVSQTEGYPTYFPYAEDYAFWLCLHRYGYLDNIQSTVLQYRIHQQSVSHRNAVLQRTSTLRAQGLYLSGRLPAPELFRIEKNEDFLEALGLSEECRIRILSRMLALSPHLIGDECVDIESARWLQLIRPFTNIQEIRKALAIYHLRAARFPAVGGRCFSHIAKAFFYDVNTCLRHIIDKLAIKQKKI